MSKQYHISEDSILEIIKIAYEAGCNGYLDLKDNISTELLKECIKLCKPINDYVGNTSLVVQNTYSDINTSVSMDLSSYNNNEFNFYSNV